MKKNNKNPFKSILGTAILLALILYSCGGDSGKTDKENDKDTTTIAKDTIIEKKDKEKNTFYKIPSPAELFIFLKDEKTIFKASALNPIENVSKYNTTDSKAINFGVYAADIAYCSMFEKNQQTAEYYSVAKQIADDLGLIEGFDKNITQRFENNIQNSDSLYQIANEAYWTAYSALENEDKTNILPYIVVGNWIESVYIAIKSVNKFSPDDKIVQRIADQDLVIDNLLSYLNLVDNKKEIEDVILQIKIILRTFEERYDNEDKKLTKKLFDKIDNKISSLRNEFIS